MVNIDFELSFSEKIELFESIEIFGVFDELDVVTFLFYLK